MIQSNLKVHKNNLRKNCKYYNKINTREQEQARVPILHLYKQFLLR